MTTMVAAALVALAQWVAQVVLAVPEARVARVVLAVPEARVARVVLAVPEARVVRVPLAVPEVRVLKVVLAVPEARALKVVLAVPALKVVLAVQVAPVVLVVLVANRVSVSQKIAVHDQPYPFAQAAPSSVTARLMDNAAGTSTSEIPIMTVSAMLKTSTVTSTVSP